MIQINPSMFREYDIRGIAETDLDDDAVDLIGAAAATVFLRNGARRVGIGRDARHSSLRIAKTLVSRLVRHGFEVIDIGLVPTPVLYFAAFHLDLDGALMVTASHNPSEYNGLKLMLGKSPLYGSQIRELYEIAQRGDFPQEKKGSSLNADLLPEYLALIQKGIHLERKIKAVIDAGNGTAGITAPTLYKALGVDLVELYCDVDGTFPNHHPDPTQPENLRALIAKVKETKADVGIGFDGDADRIGAVDDQGTILWGDQLLLLFSRDVLANHPGATIISEVKASEILYRDIAARGGVPIMWKAGHSLIKQKIKETHALLAGEVSGHIFFCDRWFGFDDAVYAGARLLELISREPPPFSRTVASIPKAYNTPEIRVDTTDEAKFAIVAKILDHFKKTHMVIDIDGARIQFPHGWALARASNTQPALVMRFEADTPDHLTEIRNEVETVISRIQREIGR